MAIRMTIVLLVVEKDNFNGNDDLIRWPSNM